ncbi:MAG: nitroreductase [Thalassovita sp.]
MTEEFEAFNALMHSRHSCRGFKPDPVPKKVVEQITIAAARVPTWCNAQPWQLHITQGAETHRFRTALQKAATTQTPQPEMSWPRRYEGVYKDRRRTCGFQLYEAVGVARGDRAASAAQMMQNYALFGAPHVAIVTSEADLGPYGAMDCGGFVAAFTIAAQAAGVATIVQAAIAGFAPTVRTFFAIPETRNILCAISFGYEDPDHPANGFRTERAAVDDVISWHE